MHDVRANPHTHQLMAVCNFHTFICVITEMIEPSHHYLLLSAGGKNDRKMHN